MERKGRSACECEENGSPSDHFVECVAGFVEMAIGFSQLIPGQRKKFPKESQQEAS
jgi:hypothetical protein